MKRRNSCPGLARKDIATERKSFKYCCPNGSFPNVPVILFFLLSIIAHVTMQLKTGFQLKTSNRNLVIDQPPKLETTSNDSKFSIKTKEY